MCCFSQSVEHVQGTQIFASELRGGLQGLVYEMELTASQDLAMVLPLPVPPGAAEDAVRFISLERYPKFFADLQHAFPADVVSGTVPVAAPGGVRAPVLKVHDVGAFEASFVPTLADFARLDGRFRLPPQIWRDLPEYRDWGFAVFKLGGFRKGLLGLGASTKKIHPMALEFPRRERDALFFPTVHVHDGTVHPSARFDHLLYCQPYREPNSDDWIPSQDALGRFVDSERSRGLVDPSLPGWRLVLRGVLPNQDTWVGTERRAA